MPIPNNAYLKNNVLRELMLMPNKRHALVVMVHVELALEAHLKNAQHAQDNYYNKEQLV